MKASIARTITTLAVVAFVAPFAGAEGDRDSTGMLADPATTATSGSAVSAYALLSVQVDDTYCATGGVQCTGTGHTAEAAGPGNHNPVRLVVQVAAPSPIDALPAMYRNATLPTPCEPCRDSISRAI